MSKSNKTYTCNNCHQSMNAKGWGNHIWGTRCDHEARIYQQGFNDAKAAMFGKLNQVKP